VRLLVREGAVFAVIGVAIGLMVASYLKRVVASLLYGVGGADPTTFAAFSAKSCGLATTPTRSGATLSEKPRYSKARKTTKTLDRYSNLTGH
jgi:hypothetical protein